MVELASAIQTLQVAKETTPGTGVAAGKKLNSFLIEPSPKTMAKQFRGTGNKFDTMSVQLKEWSEWSLSGAGTYEEIPYLWGGLFGDQTPVQQAATIAYKWAWTPSLDQAEVFPTFTFEHGSATRARSTAFNHFLSGGIAFGREDFAALSGSGVGAPLADGITMTSSPTSFAATPISPIHTKIFLDTAHGSLGTTKMTRVYSISFSLSDRQTQTFPIDSDLNTGFAATVETTPQYDIKMLVAADAVGMALLTTAHRGNLKRFIRLVTTGPLIASTYYYKNQIDMCVEVVDLGPLRDNKGIWGYEVTLRPTYSSAWTKAMYIEVITTTTAL